jgi:branched-chain amino acid transport system substrate-binding protein
MSAGGFSISARRRWRFPVLTMGALVLVATTLVALPRASAPAAASPQDGSWQLGLICSCTGPEASSTSTSAPALEAWPDAVNAKGGIDGHKVNLIVKDDDTNPTTALHEAEQLVSQDHVLAIFDNSDVDTAFATYVAQHHVPVVGSYASSNEM